MPLGRLNPVYRLSNKQNHQYTVGRPGTGSRFAAVAKKIEAKGKSPSSARAIAASIGRKKYGASQMARWAAKSRRKG